MPPITSFLTSDHKFIHAAGSVLILLGLTGIMLGLICMGFGLGLCEVNWIPIFGGLPIFRANLALINFSLAFLILGIGLKLFNPFGYLTSLVLLGLLTVAFGWLARVLLPKTELYLAHASSTNFDPQQFPILESVALDSLIALWSLAGIVYLLTKPVRKLYFASRNESSERT